MAYPKRNETIFWDFIKIGGSKSIEQGLWYNMSGIQSDPSHLPPSLSSSREEPTKQVEPLRPPADSTPGDKIIIEGYDDGVADDVLNPKKKVWEKLQVRLKTDQLNSQNIY
ncbi:PREDICTED: tyrosine--tRNA ligase, cytoplasmic-like [Wasmannia auropunctata]|uniref:tyrosine--tRNA ligase, cytoplasmic-like n=1 Tax=Wasmannia auropunctata TaxID=64793 RepID=UPI0005EF748E|nr:PREDICTED: tyrosine--tRNA ligase, cytoplasmic-like [Wasmannia auropunctata]